MSRSSSPAFQKFPMTTVGSTRSCEVGVHGEDRAVSWEKSGKVRGLLGNGKQTIDMQTPNPTPVESPGQLRWHLKGRWQSCRGAVDTGEPLEAAAVTPQGEAPYGSFGKCPGCEVLPSVLALGKHDPAATGHSGRGAVAGLAGRTEKQEHVLGGGERGSVPSQKMGFHLSMTRLWFVFPDLSSQRGERQIATKARLPASV